MSADGVHTDLSFADVRCCTGDLLLHIHERLLLGLNPVIHVFCKEWVAGNLRRPSSDDRGMFLASKKLVN